MVHNLSFKAAAMYGGSFVVGGAVIASAIFRVGGETPRTSNAEWAAATREYLRFQQMNPIGE